MSTNSDFACSQSAINRESHYVLRNNVMEITGQFGELQQSPHTVQYDIPV